MEWLNEYSRKFLDNGYLINGQTAEERIRYMAQRNKIFFNPPIRETGHNKALFKGITRGVIAGIELGEFTLEKQTFIGDCVREEKILPLFMGKVLKYNLEERGLQGESKNLHIVY